MTSNSHELDGRLGHDALYIVIINKKYCLRYNLIVLARIGADLPLLTLFCCPEI